MLKDCQTYLKSRGVNIVNFKNMFDIFQHYALKSYNLFNCNFLLQPWKLT